MKSTFALNIEKGTVELSHGAGSRASAQLIEEVFAKHFTNEWLDEGHDGALLPAIRRPVAVSCDAHVVSPLFFPGGDIGKLAVCGTVNDVAMCGAHPLYLTASFIIEEGFALADLERIVKSMAQVAKEAGVAIVTGDTKVVERGKADGVFICTSGIGEQFENTETVSGKRAQPGDVVLVSGAIGDHGTAILSRRQGLTFLTDLESDCAPLNKMVEAIMKASSHVHVLRDPTRGGLAATLNEIATQSKVGIELNESAIVVHEAVNAACEFLGLDPLYVANEGKLIAICPEEEAQAVLEAMRTDPRGKEAAIVGRVTEDNAGYVEMVTTVGGRRAVDWLNAEQLPRIC